MTPESDNVGVLNKAINEAIRTVIETRTDLEVSAFDVIGALHLESISLVSFLVKDNPRYKKSILDKYTRLINDLQGERLETEIETFLDILQSKQEPTH